MTIFGLPESAYDLQRRVRDFIDSEVVPEEAGVDGHDIAALDAVAARLRAKAGRAGLLFPDIKADWAGSGLAWRVRQLVFEEAGRSPLGAAALHCAPPDAPNIDMLEEIATPEQKARYLAPLAAGDCRSCFAMTEPAPGAGSDPSMLETTARRDGDRWILNGRKWFISGALGARFAMVLAATAEGATFFLVDADNPGWRIVRPIESLESFQMGGLAEIEIVDCVVPEDMRLGETGRGLQYAQLRLEPARLGHCMRMIGRAARVMEIACDYARERESFGNRLADLQSVQAMVADTEIDLELARLVIWQVAARLDAGLPVKQESAIAKVFVSEAVNRIADRAVQLSGARGVDASGIVGQFFQQARPFRIYDGASEVHRAAIGRRVLRRAAAPAAPGGSGRRG
jgi:acyl-CoA dehydrogenase